MVRVEAVHYGVKVAGHDGNQPIQHRRPAHDDSASGRPRPVSLRILREGLDVIRQPEVRDPSCQHGEQFGAFLLVLLPLGKGREVEIHAPHGPGPAFANGKADPQQGPAVIVNRQNGVIRKLDRDPECPRRGPARASRLLAGIGDRAGRAHRLQFLERFPAAQFRCRHECHGWPP